MRSLLSAARGACAVAAASGTGDRLPARRGTAALAAWAAVLVVFALPAQAALGERAESVAADQEALAASGPSIEMRAGYAVHTLLTRSLAVREYVGASGAVFAVAWKGRNLPDLSRLLGSHSSEYAAALPAAPRTPGRRFRRVQTGELVVETWGHMRNVQGRAFLPALLPPGVTPDDIR